VCRIVLESKEAVCYADNLVVGKAALEAQDKILSGMVVCVDANRRNVVGFLMGEVERDKNCSEYVIFSLLLSLHYSSIYHRRHIV